MLIWVEHEKSFITSGPVVDKMYGYNIGALIMLIWEKVYRLYIHTVDSRYLSWRDPLKHFDISVLWHIRCAEMRKIPIEQPNFTNEHVIWLLLVRNICWNIVEKGRNCSWGAIDPLIHKIMLPGVRFQCKTRIIFSLWDKRLFEITEV